MENTIQTFRESQTRVQDILNAKLNSTLERTSRNNYQIKNIILTSNTQIGKTNYIIKSCVNEMNTKKLIVISCDNITAQLSQLYERLIRQTNLPVYTIKTLKYSKIENHFRLGRSVVVIILGNDSQVKKLHNFITHIPLYKKPAKYLFFHDEGDMINKADDINDLDNKTISKSHRRWVNLMTSLENSNLQVCRTWISATPENCSHISRITGKDIIVLPKPTEYMGVSDHITWDGSDTEPLKFEVERIRTSENREVILYTVDKTNIVQEDTAKKFSLDCRCIALTYNMKGTIIYKNGRVWKRVKINKKDSIAEILEKLTDKGPIIVVGYNLMNRGISFVGTRMDRPMTATVMFCSSGVSSHIVGSTQKIGRICGTSRPDIPRRAIYCSDRMYSDYSSYLANQETVFSKLSDPLFDYKTMTEILGLSEESLQLKNILDRPTLKKVNCDYSESCSSDSGIDNNSHVRDSNPDKMKRLINSWRSEGNNCAVAKAFRKLLENNLILENSKVRDFFDTIGPYNAMTNSNRDANWNLVFRKDEQFHYIRDEAIEYINSL